jgi:hypothetical protein
MISLPYNETTVSGDRQRDGLIAFVFRHRLALALSGVALAAAIALTVSVVPVSRLYPALSLLPCLICMKHALSRALTGSTDASTSKASGSLDPQNATPDNR